MSVVDLTLSFWSKQAQAAKASFGEARGKALNNDLGLDDMVKLWNAFSFGTLDRWLWSSPCASGPQSKFKTHSKGNDTLEVSFSTLPLPPNANPSAALIVIRSKTGTGSGKPACTPQSTGQISISATDLKDWEEGDAFMVIGYLEDKMTSEQTVLASLLVSVTG